MPLSSPPPLPARLEDTVDPLTGNCKYHPTVRLCGLNKWKTQWVVLRKTCYKCGSRSSVEQRDKEETRRGQREGERRGRRFKRYPYDPTETKTRTALVAVTPVSGRRTADVDLRVPAKRRSLRKERGRTAAGAGTSRAGKNLTKALGCTTISDSRRTSRRRVGVETEAGRYPQGRKTMTLLRTREVSSSSGAEVRKRLWKHHDDVATNNTRSNRRGQQQHQQQRGRRPSPQQKPPPGTSHAHRTGKNGGTRTGSERGGQRRLAPPRRTIRDVIDFDPPPSSSGDSVVRRKSAHDPRQDYALAAASGTSSVHYHAKSNPPKRTAHRVRKKTVGGGEENTRDCVAVVVQEEEAGAARVGRHQAMKLYQPPQYTKPMKHIRLFCDKRSQASTISVSSTIEEYDIKENRKSYAGKSHLWRVCVSTKHLATKGMHTIKKLGPA